MLKLGEVLDELRVSFPRDTDTVRRFFAAALISEGKGELEKANNYLEKAIEAEQQGKS